MDQITVKRVKGLRIAIAAFVLSVFLFVAVIVGGAYVLTTRSDDLQDFSSALRNGLVQSCEENGNPLREAVQEEVRSEIRQRSTLDYGRFFPDVPAAELERLLAEETAEDRAILKKIAPVDCPSLYPPKP